MEFRSNLLYIKLNKMTENLSSIVLLGFGLVAGIRHGIDFDHIAAITDISSSQKKSSLALFYSILYGLGH